MVPELLFGESFRQIIINPRIFEVSVEFPFVSINLYVFNMLPIKYTIY